MSAHKRLESTILWLTALFILGGCATMRENRHYLMSPIAPAATMAGTEDVRLGIGPVSLPDHLERANLVTRESTTRVHVATGHKWAAPLESHLAEVMAENLRLRLGSDAIPAYPWPPATRVDMQLTMEVLEMTHYRDRVLLAVRWRLLDRPSTALIGRLSRLEESAGPDYDEVVDAMARVVAELADEIAAAVRLAEERKLR